MSPSGLVLVWEFRVKPGCEKEFEKIYGPQGDWAQLFRQADGYRGTQLYRHTTARNLYLTMDSWASQAAFDSFRARYQRDYQELDKKSEVLLEAERFLGTLCSGEDSTS